MEQELPKPLVSERINIVMMSFVPNIGDRDAAIRHGEKAIDEARAMEAELQRLRAQVEAMRVADIEEVRKAFGFIKEIGERDHHLTWKHDVDQMVKWANHGLASLPQQDVAAGRSVPSPVGQEPVAWMIETKVWSDTSVMLAVSRDAVVQMAVERYRECEQKHVHHSDPIPLFTHPPKAGVLTALKAEDPTS